MDGTILVFNKYSQDSLLYISNFFKNYHQVIGNKFFPCVLLQIESYNPRVNYSSEVRKETVREVSLDYTIPVIKINNNFDRKECDKVIHSILREIKKESNDEFPYTIEFHSEMKINLCIKYSKTFNVINIFLFLMIMVNYFKR